MPNAEEKIEALIAKHPHLSKEDAIKIIKEKNARKNQKRSERTSKAKAKRDAFEARRAQPNPNSEGEQ